MFIVICTVSKDDNCIIRWFSFDKYFCHQAHPSSLKNGRNLQVMQSEHWNSKLKLFSKRKPIYKILDSQCVFDFRRTLNFCIWDDTEISVQFVWENTKFARRTLGRFPTHEELISIFICFDFVISWAKKIKIKSQLLKVRCVVSLCNYSNGSMGQSLLYCSTSTIEKLFTFLQ